MKFGFYAYIGSPNAVDRVPLYAEMKLSVAPWNVETCYAEMDPNSVIASWINFQCVCSAFAPYMNLTGGSFVMGSIAKQG